MLSNTDISIVGTGHHERNPSAVPKIPRLPCYTDFAAHFEPMMPDGLFSRLWSRVEAEIDAGKEPDVRLYVARFPKYSRQVFDTVVLTIEDTLPRQMERLIREYESGRYLLDPAARACLAKPDRDTDLVPLLPWEKGPCTPSG